jgi:hypothetical protein
MPKRDVVSVLEDITDALSSSEEPLTTSEIARLKGLDWKTTEKYLRALSNLEAHGRITLVKAGTNVKLWGLERRGLASRPEEEQLRIVRKHFPEADAKDRVLVGLFLGGALDENKAVNLDASDATEELRATGMIAIRDGHGYLTDLGATIAKGLLRIYPELVKA